MNKLKEPITHDEMEVVARGLGKWSDPDVPKVGWDSVRVYDLGKGIYRVCEMCETVRIRFVHVMQHHEGLCLESGCICAGHMAEDVASARVRDDDIQRAAGRVARRAKALAKAKKVLGDFSITGSTSLSNILDYIAALERQRRVALRRADGAEADGYAYDCYFSEAQSHKLFATEIDAILAGARRRLSEIAAAQAQRELRRGVDEPIWRKTPKGYRFTTVDGDKVQVFVKGDGCYGAMYQLVGNKPVWSTIRFTTIQEAQQRALAALRQALRKAKRLDDM